MHRLYGIKEYKQAHQFNVNVMTDLLNLFSRTTKVDDEKVVYNMVNAFYLDPDGFEIRKIGGIDCSADGLLSIKRIYRKYGMSKKQFMNMKNTEEFLFLFSSRNEWDKYVKSVSVWGQNRLYFI